jgi:release factor glutamine methyltransferase
VNTTEQSEILQPTDTVGALVESATAALAAAGIPTARLDAEVLLAHGCCLDRAALYARWRSVVSADCRLRFDAAVARRQRHEPTQYIVGQQEFWSLDFVVTPDVLIPRPETELLVELALAILSEATFGAPLLAPEPPVANPSCPQSFGGHPSGGHIDSRLKIAGMTTCAGSSSVQAGVFGGRVSQGEADHRYSLPLREGEGEHPLRLCDLGTGSGCIAVALTRELPHAHVWALDVSEAALDVAQLNARRHTVAEHIHFLVSDGFSAASGLRFDAIVCNPPYVSSRELQRAQPELAWEPRRALDGGPNGLAVIERIVAEAPRYLTERGWLLMEIGADQGPAVERLARAAGFSSVSIRADYAGLPRALVARR